MKSRIILWTFESKYPWEKYFNYLYMMVKCLLVSGNFADVWKIYSFLENIVVSWEIWRSLKTLQVSGKCSGFLVLAVKWALLIDTQASKKQQKWGNLQIPCPRLDLNPCLTSTLTYLSPVLIGRRGSHLIKQVVGMPHGDIAPRACLHRPGLGGQGPHRAVPLPAVNHVSVS